MACLAPINFLMDNTGQVGCLRRRSHTSRVAPSRVGGACPCTWQWDCMTIPAPVGPRVKKNRYNIEGETTRIHFEHHGLTSMDGTSERSFSRSAEYALISLQVHHLYFWIALITALNRSTPLNFPVVIAVQPQDMS